MKSNSIALVVKYFWISGFFLACLCICGNPVFSVTIEKTGGDSLEIPALSYSSGIFRGDGLTLHRDQVTKVIFALPGAGTTTESSVLPGDPQAKPPGRSAQQSEERPIDGKNSGQNVVPLWSGPSDPAQLAAEAAKMEADYPDAERIVIRDIGWHDLAPDGSRTFRYTAAVKVLKDSAISDGTLQMGFEDDRASASFALARNILPDGRIVHADASGVKIADSGGGGDSVVRYKTVSVTIPEVVVGSVIEYALVRHEFNPPKKDMFFPSFTFSDGDPVCQSSLKVTVPAGTTLEWVCRRMNGSEEPVKALEGTSDSYTWTLRDLAPIVSEPMMPSWGDVAARITVSNYGRDWKRFFAWRRELVGRKLETTPGVRSEAEKITSGALDDLQKCAAVYHFVQENIRYVSVKSGVDSGLAGHLPEQTLASRFGDCIDKAILTSALLRAVGVDAWPVALKTNSADVMERDVVCFDTNHAITLAKPDGKTMFLDSTSSNFRFPFFREDDHGVYCINYFNDEFTFIEPPAPEDNGSVYKREYTVQDDGSAKVSMEVRYTGSREAGLRGFVKELREDAREKAVQSMASSVITGARVHRYAFENVDDISKPFWWSCEISGPGFVVPAGKYRILDPKLETSFSEANLSERKHDIKYRSVSYVHNDFLVRLPSGFRVKYAPEKVELETKWASFKGEWVDSGDGTLRLVTSFYRRALLINAADYPEYRAYLKGVEKFFEGKIFLETVENDSDDMLVTREGRETRGSLISIESDRVKFKEADTGAVEEVPVSEVSRVEVYRDYGAPGEDTLEKVSDPEVRELIASAPGPEDYPNSGYVTLKHELTLEIDSEGKVNEGLHVIRKILMERGKEMATIFGWYRSGETDFEIILARAFDNGQVTDLSGYSVTESSIYASYEEYDRVRGVKAVIPSVGVGSVIEYRTARKYRMGDASGDNPYIESTFSAREPCLLDRVVVTAPGQVAVNMSRLNWTQEVTGETFELPGGVVRHVFERRNVTPTVQENYLPPSVEFMPTIVVSSAKTYGDIAAAFSEAASNLPSPAPSSDLAATVGDLRKSSRDKSDFLVRLYEFVAENVETVECDPRILDRRPRPADEIFKRRRGHVLDKTWLMREALALGGVRADLAALRSFSAGRLPEASPDLAQFDDYGLFVRTGSGSQGSEEEDTGSIFVFVNDRFATFGVVPSEFRDTKCLLLTGPGKGALIPVPEPGPEADTYRYEGVMTLSKEGNLEAGVTLYFPGIQSAPLRPLQFLRKEELDKRMERQIAPIHSRARLLTYEFSGLSDLTVDVTEKYSYTVEGYPKTAGGSVMAFRVPEFEYSASDFARDTRIYPMFFSSKRRTVQQTVIAIPDGYRVGYLPNGLKRQVRGIYVDIAFEEALGTVTVTETYDRSETRFAREEYQPMKELLEARSRAREEWIILEKER